MVKLNKIERYYQQEIEYLYDRGAQFQKDYPQVASFLQLHGAGSQDPHVQRLIESFAFLSGKLQMNIDDEFSRMAFVLLDTLYPHLLRPFPSAGIAQFNCEATIGDGRNGFHVQKGTVLETRNNQGKLCQYRTCSDMNMLPVKIMQAEVVNNYELSAGTKYEHFLCLRIRNMAGPVRDLSGLMKGLHCQINGGVSDKQILHEIVTNIEQNSVPIFVRECSGDNDNEKNHSWQSLGAIKMNGFDDNDNMIPQDSNCHNCYGLLQEYFNFPDKFMSFVIKGLRLDYEAQEFQISLPIDSTIDIANFNVSCDNIQVNCTPIINLFNTSTQPWVLDHTKYEQMLIIDNENNGGGGPDNIYNIRSVHLINDKTDVPLDVSPFFGYNHSNDEHAENIFWCSRYLNNNASPYLSLHGFDYKNVAPDNTTVYAQVWACNNNEQIKQLIAGQAIESNIEIPAEKISLLHAPSLARDNELDGGMYWRLISQLSLNHLSLINNNELLSAVQEIIMIYGRRDSPEIKGIKAIDVESCVGRVGIDAWRGFVKGLKIDIELSQRMVDSGSGLVFGSVLAHFLRVVSHVNSFVNCNVRRYNSNATWGQWRLLSGLHDLL